MSFDVPDACMLPTAEQPPRLAEFDDLFATSVRRVDPISATHARLRLAGPAGRSACPPTRPTSSPQSSACPTRRPAMQRTSRDEQAGLRTGEVAGLAVLALGMWWLHRRRAAAQRAAAPGAGCGGSGCDC
jgi:hypothetical protein